MKTISDYTIHCTPEQTKKAIELGAPIEKVGISQRDSSRPVFYTDDKNENPECDAYYRSTAEEMIGWLEGQYIYKIYIDSVNRNGWYFIVYVDEGSSISNVNIYPSRKEATLAAIDGALECLSNKK